MKNNIIQNITRKFYFSLFAVMFSFLAFSQATFAWITLSNEALLEDAQLNVIAESGFYVSLDGKNYSECLKQEDLEKIIGKNPKLYNVTSLDGKKFFTKQGEEIKDAKDNYISFDLWFKTDNPTSKELFLVDNVSHEITYEIAKTKKVDGTFVVSKGVKWVSDIDFSYGEEDIKKGSIGSYYAANAIRIAIIEENLENEFGVNEKEDLLSIIYDPSENEKMGYGVQTGAFEYYSKRLTVLNPPKEYPNTKYSLTTFKNPYEAKTDDSMCARFQKVINSDGTPSYVAKVKVNIWLEGWDADCFNAIFADNVMVQLKFMGSSYFPKKTY